MQRRIAICLGCAIAASAGSPLLQAQQATLPLGTALRIALDHRVRSRVGAAIRGHLTEPVYLVDREVIPVGALVSGKVRSLQPGAKSVRIQRLLAADFTPPRVPDAVFDTISVPATATQAAHVLFINAPAVQTNATVLRLGTTHKKQSIKEQVVDILKRQQQEAKDTLKQHRFVEIVEKWAVGQLPYHPDILWSNTTFNADLATPATVPDATHPPLPIADLHGRLPEGTLHARLLSPLTSQTAKHGDPVEAIITRPLLSADGSQLLVPEGIHLHGVVVRTKAARSFGRNGDLRFAFRSLDLPSAEEAIHTTEIHGRLSAAETAPEQHVSIDEEGQARTEDGPAKYAEPVVLAALVGVARGDPDHRGDGGGIGPGGETVASNGFGLIARVVSLSTQNRSVVQGFAYYSLAKSLYFNFVAKGHDMTFAHDTEIQVTLSER